MGGVLGGICSHEASPRNPEAVLVVPGPVAAKAIPCADQVLPDLSGSGPTRPSSRPKRGQTWLLLRFLTGVCPVGFSRELGVNAQGRAPGLVLLAAPLKTRDCSRSCSHGDGRLKCLCVCVYMCIAVVVMRGFRNS